MAEQKKDVTGIRCLYTSKANLLKPYAQDLLL